jgi:uncharacterized membrane protein
MGTIPKWILGSKVFWFNVLAGVVAVAQAFGFAGFTPDPSVAEYVTVAVAVINIILRLVTTQPVCLSRPAKTITFGDVKRKA